MKQCWFRTTGERKAKSQSCSGTRDAGVGGTSEDRVESGWICRGRQAWQVSTIRSRVMILFSARAQAPTQWRCYQSRR